MTTRILGLIGSGEGPRVGTRQLGDTPVAKIVGLKCAPVTIEMHDEDGMCEIQVFEDGVVQLLPSPRMRVRAPAGNFGMICTLHAKAS